MFQALRPQSLKKSTLLLAALSLALGLPAAAVEPPLSATPKTAPEKSATLEAWCTATHQLCMGSYDEMVDSIVVHDNGNVYVIYQEALADWIEANVACSFPPNAWRAAVLDVDVDGQAASLQDRAKLNLLYVSDALDRQLLFRFGDDGTGHCELLYLSINQPNP